MRLTELRIAGLALAALLGACASWTDGSDRGDASPAATAPLLHADHPLAGRIWRPAEGRFATAGEIYASLKKAELVLLGEKHDNPEHHRIQALLLREMATVRRRPAVVFEMLTTGQQAPLDRYLAGAGDAAGLGAAVGWAESGWPDWSIYRPIAEIALAADMPVLAGGLERDVSRAVSKGGVDALGPGRAAALRIDQPLPEDMRAAMRAEVHDSHCGVLPDSMLDPMVAVTLAKDATMAEKLVESAASSGRDSAVLIAGNGHVRADYGVPWHLRRLAAGSRGLSIGMIEVVAGETDPAGYVDQVDGRFAYDFVWFTGRVDDDDPCAAYADQLQHLKERAPAPAESGGN